MIPGTSQRVPEHTDQKQNDRIRRRTEMSICYYLHHPQQIDARLATLEREWDIERLLEVNGSVLALTGLVLGVTRARRWLALPTAVVGFCLQHALQGWCPPLTLFRRLGVRTQREIDEERFALMALRGDFHDLPPPKASSVGAAAQAVLDTVRTGVRRPRARRR